MKKWVTTIFLIIFSFLFSNETNRYIILSPEVAEIIAALGRIKNVVAITKECDYPLEYNSKKKVGSFGNINFEQIIKLKPTLVFTSGLEHSIINSKMKKMGINYFVYYPKNINEMFESIIEIGSLINSKKIAHHLVDSLKNQLNSLKKSNSPKVYIEIYGNPLMSCSKNSFVGNILEVAGGNNIFSDLKRDYSKIINEEVIKKKPEIIIVTYPNAKRVKNRKGWSKIPAILNKQVYYDEDINPDFILRASPRVILGIKKLNNIFIKL